MSKMHLRQAVFTFNGCLQREMAYVIMKKYRK